ncbi:MAG: hypothetical protein IJ298_05220, partial [Ruminococcus sp.]|nr:hypothetical protein [Ruminococcus sp.]
LQRSVVGAFQKPSCGRSDTPIHSTIYSVAYLSLERDSKNYYFIIRGVIYDEVKYSKHDGGTLAYFLKTLQRVSEEDDIRFYDGSDYFYRRGKFDSGERATLPDDWQNYGYTTGKQNGRRFPAGPEGGVPGTGGIRPDERKNSYGDDDFNLWGLLDPEEETPETTERSELLEGFVQTAGTLLEKTRSIPLEDGRIRRIANTVIRRLQQITIT